MGNKTDRIYRAVCERLFALGLRTKAAAMVAFAMAAEGLTYEAARDAYAEWIGEAPERLQSVLCADVLRAGHEVSPARILAEALEGGIS